MTGTRRPVRWIGILTLLTAPLLALGIARSLQWVDAAGARSTLIGMAIAALGGVMTGAVVERFLHRGRNELENVLGLVATTALGISTIGILYLVHIRGPMAAIGSLPRAIRQGLSFLEFLTAQGAGILMASAIIRDKAPHTS